MTDKYLEKSISECKKSIVEGKFLLDNLLSQYHSVNSINPLKRFCLYKSDIESTWRGIDCDVSLAAIVMYSMLHSDWLEGESIRLQSGSGCKYCIQSKTGNQYRGDTLTSAWTIFSMYLSFLWDKEKGNSDFRQLFGKSQEGKLTTILPKDDPTYDSFMDYFFKLVVENPYGISVVESKISSAATDFLSNYLRIGNCIEVPEGFNVARSNKGQWDTVDRMLWKIYQYFCNGNDSKYLYEMFTKNKCVAVENCLKWFEDSGINKEDININRWKKFVKENLLEPFVDLDTPDWKPISLKTGAPISEDDEDYRPLPTTIIECEKFFETANKGIKERNILIWKKCKDNYEKE